MDIEVDHYRKLIAPSPGVRIVLIALDMPNDIDRWLETAPECLVLRNCAYWRSLEGEPDVPNTSKVRVKVPRSQMFGVDAVQGVLRRVASREDPISRERRSRQLNRSSRSLPNVGRRPSP